MVLISLGAPIVARYVKFFTLCLTMHPVVVGVHNVSRNGKVVSKSSYSSTRVSPVYVWNKVMMVFLRSWGSGCVAVVVIMIMPSSTDRIPR